MYRDKEIDAIFIGTPNQLHVPMALEAVKNGKHILVTKPLADSEAAALKLVKAAEAKGVVNMMSLSTRFSDSCRYLGNLTQRKYFGDLYYARARSVRRSGIPAWNLGFIQQGGGAFRDMGVHVLDAVWWLLDNPAPVTVTRVDLPKKDSSWDNIAEHFISCILDGTPCEAPLRHGLIVQQMMEGLLKSAQTSKEIRLTR
jgi:predicted dehydrogenase